jgi:hypothetical protein
MQNDKSAGDSVVRPINDGDAKGRSIRLYHFLPAEFALDDVEKRRIKISQIDQLNDPFELWCVYQKNWRLRWALRAYKEEMNTRFGLLCYSRHWHNPLLWSLYANKHRGMCLGFDLPQEGVRPITYLIKRPLLKIPPTQEDTDRLLFSKFADWKYEEEFRNWFHIDERDAATGFYFYPFDKFVRLREVIAGPLCDVPAARIREALKGYKDKIRIIKARLAFRSFRVVKNRKGFSSTSMASG